MLKLTKFPINLKKRLKKEGNFGNLQNNIYVDNFLERKIQMKNNKVKDFFKKVLVIAFIIYFIYTIISQQRTLNSYAQEKEQYNEQIETAQEEQEELQNMKDNINSNEYIEEIAREKLGMYYPNERVYIDVEK